MSTRRGLLLGILASGLAPAIVRASSLMSWRATLVAVSTGPWSSPYFDEYGRIAGYVRYRRSGMLVRTARDGRWQPERVSRLVTPAEAAAERARLEAADRTLVEVAPQTWRGHVLDWRNGQEPAARPEFVTGRSALYEGGYLVAPTLDRVAVMRRAGGEDA